MTGRPLVDVILDEAQQKGTGKWTSQNAFDLGAPIPTINAAVEARMISALKEERVAAEQGPAGPVRRLTGDREAARRRTCGTRSTPQDLLVRAGHVRCCAWRRPNTTTTSIRARSPRIWRAGCIIRAALLDDIREAFKPRPELANLLLDRAFSATTSRRAVQDGWRVAVQTAVAARHPVPALGASLAYFDAIAARGCPRT